MYYVYEWYIVETGEIIYVGKGTHRRYKVTKHNRFFNDMIRRYDCESRIIKEFENEKDAFAYEYDRVRELKTIGQCVCNIYEGGNGGTTEWWNDELRKKYSEHNVMKSEAQRKRMSVNNPMKRPEIAEKTNGQKRKPVIIEGKRYISIKAASIEFNVSPDTINQWCIKGHNTKGAKCEFAQKSIYGNQQPSRGNANKSTPEGSTTNG